MPKTYEETTMNTLFESTRINTLTLANRFIRSATWAGMADDDGNYTPQLLELMTELANGGVGLIITGHSFVCIKMADTHRGS